MKICIKTTDGVAIMTVIIPADTQPIGNELAVYADNEVSRWAAANRGKYISHRPIADENIPTDRSKRHLWADLGGPDITILSD